MDRCEGGEESKIVWFCDGFERLDRQDGLGISIAIGNMQVPFLIKTKNENTSCVAILLLFAIL